MRYEDQLNPLRKCMEISLENLLYDDGGAQEINPLTANSDHDQFSPNNIHTLSTDTLLELIK